MIADHEEREWWVFRVLRFQDRKPQGVAYVPAASLEEARANLKRNVRFASVAWGAKQEAVEAFRHAAWLKLAPPFDGRIFDAFLDD